MKRLELICTERVQETHDAYSLFLSSKDGAIIPFVAGQYITLIVAIEGEEHRRAYSISNAPSSDHIRITIKRVQGGLVSNFLGDSEVEGKVFEALPPLGNFCVEADPSKSHHYLLFGAGSGISPLMSILLHILKQEPLSQVSLWYGNRTKEDIIFQDEMWEAKETFGERFQLSFYLSQYQTDWKGGKGRLDTETIYELISELFMVDLFRKSYFLCGPEGMMEGARGAMDKHAINPAHIFQEKFAVNQEDDPQEEQLLLGVQLPKLPELTGQFVNVQLDEELHRIEVQPKENILHATIAKELDPPYACQAGICTACRAKLNSGKVYMLEDSGLSDKELAEGYILTCQAYPLTEGVDITFE